MSRFSNISDDDFAKVVARNYCIRDIVGELGYSRASGSMAQLVRRRIDYLNLDVSHFLGRKAKSNTFFKYELSDILVEDSTYENMTSLKSRLISAGLLEYKCSKCGNIGVWDGEPLVLQLEHKNGIHNDNRLENLCFLCPNCHSQTKTYAGRNIGRYTDVDKFCVDEFNLNGMMSSGNDSGNFCVDCGRKITKKALRCKSCKAVFENGQRGSCRPDKDVLKSLLMNKLSFLEIGKLYAVSDNAVRKWCDFYGFPRRRRDIESMCDDDWNDL